MFKHLLIPLDGSEFAEAALPYAAELGQKFGSELILLAVTSIPFITADPEQYPYTGMEYVPELGAEMQNEMQHYLAQQQEKLQAQGLTIQVRVEEGNQPAEVILSLCEEGVADGVVMSTHGRGGVSRWMFGSVADKVLRHASVPVLLIRGNKGRA